MSLSHPLPRELTRPVFVGDVQIGGGAPVVVQSMTCTDTADAQATLAQVRALAQAGCDVVRVSVPTEAALEGFRTICAESPVPIVADIHFNHKLAIGAVKAGAAKLRINPGNIGDWTKVDAVIDAAGAAGCAIRIGVNAGSLEQDIAERDDLTQPEKLVMSSERFVKHFEDRGFTNIVLSAKAHSVSTTLDTYRALSREIPHVPLHLGVTEAGTKLQGTIKSSVGLGILLSEGIGDTMRVSLTADPPGVSCSRWVFAAVAPRSSRAPRALAARSTLFLSPRRSPSGLRTTPRRFRSPLWDARSMVPARLLTPTWALPADEVRACSFRTARSLVK